MVDHPRVLECDVECLLSPDFLQKPQRDALNGENVSTGREREIITMWASSWRETRGKGDEK